MTDEIIKDLAGPLYDQLVKSKESALGHLNAPERNLRIAAINVCDRVWGCSAEVQFVNTCQQIAATDPDESVRAHAVVMIGKAFQDTKDATASRFVAGLVKENTSSERVRLAAYWALREIQLGSNEQEIVQGLISLFKLASRTLPLEISERDKKVLLCGGRYPDELWDSADQIDWDFVDQFASRGTEGDRSGIEKIGGL